MPEVCNVDEAVLTNPANEEARALDYHLNGVAYLLNRLEAECFVGSPLFTELLALCHYFERETAQREQGRELDAANITMLYGSVGAALFHLRGRESPQMRTELERFANDPQAIVGNYFLFYIAGRLAGRGWATDFVRECQNRGEQRPDLRAERGGQHIFIEANARQPVVPVDNPDRLWRMIQTLVEEKRRKFVDPAFQPGIILADISPAHFVVNEHGTPPFLELRRDLAEPLPDGGFIYRLYEDVDWQNRLHNQGNVFAYAVEHFQAIDRARFGVTQFLLSMVRRAIRMPDGKIAYPRYGVLLVDHARRAEAVVDLARAIYLV